MKIVFIVLIFIVAGFVIGYYGDICYACMARKKYLLGKLGINNEPCGPYPYEEGDWKCTEKGWIKIYHK